jgi:hypothetical protein
MVTLMGEFRKYWVFQKVLSVTLYKKGDKSKLTGMLNIKGEVTITFTKDHFTTLASEMTLMYVYEIPWPPLYVSYRQQSFSCPLVKLQGKLFL